MNFGIQCHFDKKRAPAQKYDFFLWNLNREKHTGRSWWKLRFSLCVHFWCVCKTKSCDFVYYIWCKVCQTHGSFDHNLKALLWKRCNDNTMIQAIQLQKENIWWEALRSNLEVKCTHYLIKKRIATWFRFSGCFMQLKWMQTDLNNAIVACKTHESL